MLIIGESYPVEGYKSYKNRNMTKHIDKIKNQMQQIKSGSLKFEDKKHLIQSMIEEINNTQLK